MKSYNRSLLIWLVASLLLACQEETGTSNKDPGLDVWATPDVVSVSAASYSFCPDIAINQSGDAIVVWNEDEGKRKTITVFVNTYSEQSGWGVPAIIDPAIDAYWSTCPHIAMNDNGDAIVGWQSEDGGLYRYSMWVKQYTLANGWEPAKRVDAQYSGAEDVLFVNSEVAIDEFGNAVAVWTDENNITKSIWANNYTFGQGWGLAQIISAIDVNTSIPTVAMGAGSAIAIWKHGLGVAANTYQAGVGWGTVKVFENGNGYASIPQVAMSADGSGIVIWEQEEYHESAFYAPTDIYANHYNGTSWGDIIRINPIRDLRYSNSEQIAMDADGNAIAVWMNISGGNRHISASYYNKSLNQWDVTERISANGSSFPDVAMASNGDAAVSWSSYIYNDIHSDINVRRFSKDTGWGPAGRIGRAYISDSVSDVKMDFNNQGNIFTVWEQTNTAVNEFNPPYDVFAGIVK